MSSLDVIACTHVTPVWAERGQSRPVKSHQVFCTFPKNLRSTCRKIGFVTNTKKTRFDMTMWPLSQIRLHVWLGCCLVAVCWIVAMSSSHVQQAPSEACRTVEQWKPISWQLSRQENNIWSSHTERWEHILCLSTWDRCTWWWAVEALIKKSAEGNQLPVHPQTEARAYVCGTVRGREFLWPRLTQKCCRSPPVRKHLCKELLKIRGYKDFRNSKGTCFQTPFMRY